MQESQSARAPDQAAGKSFGRGRLALILLFACLVVFLPTASRDKTHIDVYDAALASWRIAETGAPWLDGFDLDSLGRKTDLFKKFIGEAPNGHIVVNRAPGVVAVGVPAYWIAGSERFETWPQALLAAGITSFSVVLLYLGLTACMPRRRALAVAAVFAFATPVWSIAADGIWPHTLTLLGICGMIWASATRRWWIAGCLGGIAIWGRVHVALVVAVLGLGVAISRRDYRIALKVGLTSTALLGLATVWTHWMYGRWSPTGGYVATGVLERVGTADGRSPVGLVVNQLGMWVAPDRGILVWTPILLVLAPALIRSWRMLPDWSRWLLIGGFIYTVAQAWYSPFYGGDGLYGYRLGLEFLACATPAFALSWPQAQSWARLLAGPVLGAQFAILSAGAATDAFHLGEGTSWTQHVFIEAAMAIPLLWVWLGTLVTIGTLLAIRAIDPDPTRRRVAQND